MSQVPTLPIGSFWKGQDGNVYVYGDQGVNSAGVWDDNTYDYWTARQYQGIADPNYGSVLGDSDTNTFNSTSTGGGGPSPSYSADDLALINDQINTVNQGINRLGSQRSIGLDNIINSFRESQNKLSQDRGLAERDYNTTKQDSTNQYLDSRSGIRREAGNMYNSGRRLLGSAGAGRSSALDLLLPFAVGKEAAMRFGETQDTFGRNQRDLDTSWADTSRRFDEAGTDLEKQKKLKENELESGILQNEAGLRDDLAQLQLRKSQLTGGDVTSALAGIQPIRDRINSILGLIDNLGKQYSGAVKTTGDIKYSAPDLAQYDYSKFAAPTVNGQPSPLADYVSPIASILQKREEEK